MATMTSLTGSAAPTRRQVYRGGVRAAAVLVAVLTVVVSGCGGEPAPAGALGVVRSALARSAEADSFRFRMEARAGIAEDRRSDAVLLEAEGSVDARRGRGTLRVRGLPVPGGSGTSAVEVRILPDALYLDLGPVVGNVPGAGRAGTWRWLRLDLPGVGDSGPGLGRWHSGPADLLDLLGGVSEDLEAVGREPVHGTPTTRYRGTLDPAVALRRLSEGAPPERRAALRAFGLLRIPAEVWIDDDGNLRRFRVQGEGDRLGVNGAGGPVTVTYEILATGVPVTVEPPPHEETVAGAEALAGLLGRLLGAAAVDDADGFR